MRLLATIAIVSLAGAALGAQAPSPEIQRKIEAEKAMQERKTVLEEKVSRQHPFVGVARERVPLEKTVKGAPYSAEIVVESNQALVDGNRINQKTTGRVYRDGEGRTRREEDRSDGLVSISIVDPVAGVSYALDPENHIAWKTEVAATEEIVKKIEEKRREERARMEVRRAGSVDAPSRADAELEGRRKREAELETAGRARGRGVEEHNMGPLERKTLEGVTVEGRRSTTTIRAGAIGNDLPLTITSEEWSSPDLKVLVMTRRTDPRSGESSYRLTNVIRAEPDRSLFQVPPDYTVKETGISRFEQNER